MVLGPSRAFTRSVHLARLVLDAGVRFGVSCDEIALIPEFEPAAFEDDLSRIPIAAQRQLWELVHAAGGPTRDFAWLPPRRSVGCS